jgi:hypothetical protein
MNAEAVRETRDSNPFVPFVMHLADGRAFRVGHPELLLIPPKNPRIIVLADGEHIRIIDVLLVVELELDTRKRKAG